VVQRCKSPLLMSADSNRPTSSPKARVHEVLRWSPGPRTSDVTDSVLDPHFATIRKSHEKGILPGLNIVRLLERSRADIR
jgi:hypothetical protein